MSTRWGALRRLALPALVLIPLLYPGIVLFHMNGLVGADLEHFFLPHQSFVRENLRAGIIPFWNPHSFAGIPEFGNPEIAPMYPPRFFGLWFLGPVGMEKALYLFHLILAGAGCFLFLRSLSISTGVAFLAAWTLQWSGFQITKFSLPTVGAASAWLPFLLYLQERFLRDRSTRRALLHALGGGIFLLLFYPQISVPVVLVLFLRGFAGLGDSRRLTAPGRGTPRFFHLLDRFLLPASEILLLAFILRHPPRPVPFPEPGWRCAFDGMGSLGVAVLGMTLLLWAVWLGGTLWRRQREKTRGMGASNGTFSLALGLIGIWLLASGVAAPQLAVTAEFVRQSNQASARHEKDEDFFTGAQAYGSVREFVRHSAGALPKELVNNMALGPLPWILLALGIALGLHRRDRLFAVFFWVAALVLCVYMAAPGVFDLFRRLPFFGKFAGLSRYLGFLNLSIVILAALSYQSLSNRLPRRIRAIVAGFALLAACVNLALLLGHQYAFWNGAAKPAPSPIPRAVATMIHRGLNPTERILVDTRGQVDYLPFLSFPFVHQQPGISGYSPLRLRGYDQFLAAHNASLGVNHDSYHGAFFEPAPSAWTRALRVGGFIFPPGAEIFTDDEYEGAEDHALMQGPSGWSMLLDTTLPPLGWPESEPERPEPRAQAIADWRIVDEGESALFGPGLHRARHRVHNPGSPTWLALSRPWYPGWRVWVNDRPVASRPAHGFLLAAPIPEGFSVIRLEYRPRSFQMGWLVFLWSVWVWLVLWRYSKSTFPAESRLLFRRDFVKLALCGAVPTFLVAGRVLWKTPDSLTDRLIEFAVVAQLAFLAGLIVRAKLGRRRRSLEH